MRSFVTGAGKGRSTGRQRAEAAQDIQRQVARLAKATGLTGTQVRDAAQAYHQAVQRQQANAPAAPRTHAPSFAAFVEGWGRGGKTNPQGNTNSTPGYPSPGPGRNEMGAAVEFEQGGSRQGNPQPGSGVPNPGHAAGAKPDHATPGESPGDRKRTAAQKAQAVKIKMTPALEKLFRDLGISDIETHVFTEQEVARLPQVLRQPAPVDSKELADVWGGSHFSEPQLRGILQDYMNMLPPSLVAHLKNHQKVIVKVDSTLAPIVQRHTYPGSA